MPKDPTRNIARYKIDGGHLNEFEFHKNQEQLAEQERNSETKFIPGTSPQQRAKRVQELQKASAELTQTSKPKKQATKSARPPAARKLSKKSVKKTAKKTATAKRKTATKKASTSRTKK